MHILDGHELCHLSKLRNRSISVSKTGKDSTQMKLGTFYSERLRKLVGCWTKGIERQGKLFIIGNTHNK